MSVSTSMSTSKTASSSCSTSSSRVAFDDDTTTVAPQESVHWQRLQHQENDAVMNNLQELKDRLQRDILRQTENDGGQTLALWSCICGYVEALATHKQPQRRYQIFPIPVDALKRLVDDEFIPMVQQIKIPPKKTAEQDDGKNSNSNHHHDSHRQMVRAISNAVWAKAIPKPNVRDELHANSLYVCLRGNVDRKSLDCFGAALVTVLAVGQILLQQQQQQSSPSPSANIITTKSCLTLSEDHAYERHEVTISCSTTKDGEATTSIGTCEVAVPGNTKLAQSKRGRDIQATFNTSKDNKMMLTPETSWLYMASNPVICDSMPMTLVAIVGNINCTIEKTKQGKSFSSGQLYDFKRELLWVLYDYGGGMTKFPFGLMELGDCEEHRGTQRSEEWVTVVDSNISEPILMNEKLFWEAIQINQSLYDESQTYPYFYAGHYHKDAGNSTTKSTNVEEDDQEYRLVHAVKYYADAARVASKYRYEGVDSMQLNKHMSAVAMLLGEDILTPKYSNNPSTKTNTKKEPRQWKQPYTNAVAVTTWLLGFFDSLLYWEEKSGSKQFVEILSPSHKFSMGRLFQLLPHDVRTKAIAKIFLDKDKKGGDDDKLPYFFKPRSKRMTKTSLLIQALQKPKVAIREMELSIPSIEDPEGERRSKRIRR